MVPVPITPRLNQASTTYQSAHGYIGQYYDSAPALSYLNARYYSGGQGQFLSEDPVFLSNPKAQNLASPQSLNAYSYAENNPITGSDPSGKALKHDSPTNIIRDLESSVFSLSQSVSAFAQGLVHNFSGTVQSIGSAAIDPNTYSSAFAGMTNGAANSINDAFSGDTSRQEQGIANGIVLFGSLAAPETGGSAGIDTAEAADKISGGHAYDKHVQGINNKMGQEFGSIIQSRQQFSDYIKSVMDDPYDTRQLSGGRSAYYDDRFGGVVIYNPNVSDAGTAFRADPSVHGYSTNYDYFLNGIQ